MQDKKDSNKADVNFMQEMIVHHEVALMMAKEVNINGVNLEVKLLADEIIKSQASQIKQMKKWLTDRGQSEKSEAGHGM